MAPESRIFKGLGELLRIGIVFIIELSLVTAWRANTVRSYKAMGMWVAKCILQ